MSNVTYDEMALAALKYGRKDTSLNNVRSLVIWACSENDYVPTKGKAKWNPWDTTEPEPGDTDLNSAGVKNYETIEEGLKGFWDTLNNGFYKHIIACLDDSAPPTVTCEAIYASPWGSKPSSSLVIQVLADWNHYSNLLVGGSDDKPIQTTTYTEPVVVPKLITINPEIAKVLDAINAQISDIHQYASSGNKAEILRLLDGVPVTDNLLTHMNELDTLLFDLKKEL